MTHTNAKHTIIGVTSMRIKTLFIGISLSFLIYTLIVSMTFYGHIAIGTGLLVGEVLDVVPGDV